MKLVQNIKNILLLINCLCFILDNIHNKKDIKQFELSNIFVFLICAIITVTYCVNITKIIIVTILQYKRKIKNNLIFDVRTNPRVMSVNQT